MSVVTQLYFQIVEKNNYMFRPFSGWAIVRLGLEYVGKLIYYNLDIIFIHLISICVGKDKLFKQKPCSLRYHPEPTMSAKHYTRIHRTRLPSTQC
jgi:hypothetical protein